MVDMILFIVQIFVLPVLALIQLIIAAYRYHDSKKAYRSENSRLLGTGTETPLQVFMGFGRVCFY